MRRLWVLALAAVLVALPAGATWADEPPAKDPTEAVIPAGIAGTAALEPAPRAGAGHYVSWPSPVLSQAIPDNNPAGTFHDILVADPGVVFDLDLSVTITHTWVGDLKVQLTHLDTGTTVALIDRPGVPTSTFGCSSDHVGVSLDDEALLPAETQCSPTPPALWGSLIPNNPLTAFDGETLAGTWRLTVSDGASGDTGLLTGWTLHLGVERCNGQFATLIGTNGADTLIGTSGDDVIAGLKGNDLIDGLGGSDLICGGGGKDTLVGGGGSDHLFGGAGEDTADYSAAGAAVVVNLPSRTATGGAGTDTLTGIENVIGSAFSDQIFGSTGPNKIFGGFGHDRLVGNAGNDRLIGGGGRDTLEGNAGDDFLLGGAGNDTASGGIGTDTCDAETETGCEI